jgi:hypothetical protein
MASPPIKLPEPYDSQLTALAKRRNTTRAKALREALTASEGGAAKPKRRTASELAGDLMFEGPGDLSTNPNYMSGFGR